MNHSPTPSRPVSAGQTTTLRSGWTLDGQRIFVEHDSAGGLFRVGTRWAWVLKFPSLQDACDAFDALEFLEGSITTLAKHLATEIRRTPRHRCARSAAAMARVVGLVHDVELRLRGLRPQACGSKLALVRWVPVRTGAKVKAGETGRGHA